MTKTETILEKQMEISSHQSHFNLALVFVTALLVLIYALNGFLSFSEYLISNILFGFIIVLCIIILFFLIVFMIRQGFHKKIWNRLILGK